MQTAQLIRIFVVLVVYSNQCQAIDVNLTVKSGVRNMIYLSDCGGCAFGG